MSYKSALKILFWLLICTPISGQSLKSLNIILDTVYSTITAPASFKKLKLTEVQLQSILKEWVDSLQDQGFLEGHIKKWYSTDTSLASIVHIGPKYQWTIVALQSISPAILPSLNLGTAWMGKKIEASECNAFMQKILMALDDQGYPFAQTFLDSSTIALGQITSRLNVVAGPKIIIDTIQWDDDLYISNTMLKRMIGLQSGLPFNKQNVMAIKKSLEGYPFIESYAEPQIIFFKNKAIIKLFLREKKSSYLDALLGFLPGARPGDRIKINGNFTGYFLNQLKRGESVAINFQSLQNNSQNLKINLNLPYFLNLPFSPFANFNIYKRDSLFLDVRAEGGAQWSINARGRFTMTLGTSSSTLLKPNLKVIQSTYTLPPALDIRQNYLAGTIQFKRLNDTRNPRKGYIVSASVNGSTREIKPNAAIIALKDPTNDAYSYADLYQPYKKKGYALDWGLETSVFTPMGLYSTWYTAIKAHGKKAATPLQANELYRMGGFNLLRGFDEESILAKQYVLWTNEWRLITGSLSYIHVHSDLSRINARNSIDFKPATYWSLGGGLVFDTSLGLLSITSSVGRIFPEAFNLRTVKLHVGYINYF